MLGVLRYQCYQVASDRSHAGVFQGFQKFDSIVELYAHIDVTARILQADDIFAVMVVDPEVLLSLVPGLFSLLAWRTRSL